MKIAYTQYESLEYAIIKIYYKVLQHYLKEIKKNLKRFIS